MNLSTELLAVLESERRFAKAYAEATLAHLVEEMERETLGGEA